MKDDGDQALSGCFLTLTSRGRKEQAITVNELQPVPLNGVVGGGDDNSTSGLLFDNDVLHSRGRNNSNINHIESHSQEDAMYNSSNPRATDSRITSNNDGGSKALKFVSWNYSTGVHLRSL